MNAWVIGALVAAAPPPTYVADSAPPPFLSPLLQAVQPARCGAKCRFMALVLPAQLQEPPTGPARARDSQSGQCLIHPELETVAIRGRRKPVSGIRTSVAANLALEGPDWRPLRVEIPVFLLVDGPGGVGISEQTVCEPSFLDLIQVETAYRAYLKLQGAPSSVFAADERPAVTAGITRAITQMLPNTRTDANRRQYLEMINFVGRYQFGLRNIGQSLSTAVRTTVSRLPAPAEIIPSSWLLGWSSASRIQVRVRSVPAGAEIIVNGNPSGYSTEVMLALRPATFRDLRIRIGDRVLGIDDCDLAKGNVLEDAVLNCPIIKR